MKRWLHAHLRAFTGTTGRLIRAPLASLFNMAVISVALALPLGFYVLLANLQELARHFPARPQISLFLDQKATAADARAIELRLKQHDGITGVRFVSRTQALELLQSRAGLTDILAGLDHNPLPDAFVADGAAHDPAALERLRAEFTNWPKVAEVQVDSDWARRLESLLAIGRYAVLMLTVTLAFALIAITFNTIRLQILTQREEIEITRLIGATDAHIQRPFLYLGALTGGIGGLVAWLMVLAALQIFNQQLAPLSALYGISLQLSHLRAPDSAVVLLFSAWLGWLGAWLSTRRHLHAVKNY